MVIKLIGRNTIKNLWIPETKDGQFSMQFGEKNSYSKLVFIKKANKYIISETFNCFLKPQNDLYIQNVLTDAKGRIILKNNDVYYVVNRETGEKFLLYCYPKFEDDYFHLRIKNTSVIYIGTDRKSNNIVYDFPFINTVHVQISFFNGIWMLENYDKHYCISVNGNPIKNNVETVISNGDQIDIFGLKIIIVGKEIFINRAQNKVNWNRKYFEVIDDSDLQIFKAKEENNPINQNNEYYFLRTPRLVESVQEQEISLSSPQIQKKVRELPTLVVMGSSLGMALMTFVTVAQTMDNLFSGKTTLKSAIFSFIMSGIMMITSILIPSLNRYFSNKIRKLNEKDLIEDYKKYIKNKTKLLDNLLKHNRDALYENYVSAEECMDIILNNQSRLWERKISDNDFLTVRLGVGDTYSNIKVSCQVDDKADENNEAIKLMLDFIEKSKMLRDAPILFSLKNKNISAILYENEKYKYRYIKNILLQLITFHSYDELKLVFLLKDTSDGKWDFVKMLPHVWNNSNDIRFFADDENKMNEISQYLENEFKKRIKEDDKSRNNIPYFLIIIDDYRNVEALNIINEILKSKSNLGFSILFLTDSILKLPNECQTFIKIENNRATLFESKNSKENRISFRVSTSEEFFFDKISSILFDIPIKYNEEKEMMLPSSYTFLEMYNVGKIEQLGVYERWKSNDSTVSLAAPLGIDGEGKLISLDIHEKFHGPHGLVAGSTGSGKSELIITYILSLAINYHPDDVTFVLIDYKGGGLAGAFKRPDVQLPHLVGTITNIDKSSLQRSLESIKSELQRRQVEFNKARNITGESTIDIYKYQRYYHSGVIKEPISHLFIISDEFAELKQQEPDFMDELISVARIGRSLGVHLILATQKPSGVVNDQIRSNTKFGICLKVQTASDSKDVIGIPDAANLKGAGQFYLKVGNDDYLALGQSAWSGALYYPSDETKKERDDSIEFITSTGKILKRMDDVQKNVSVSKGEQLTNLVKYMSDLAKVQNIHEKPLWLNPIPETIYLQDIRKKYNVKTDKNIINPVIGEYDDPSRQLQNVMQLNLSTDGNTVIYGNAESGKETLLNTMIYDIITNYSTEVAQIYILDFGSEAMKIFKKSAHVGDVILSSEKEKVARFFMMLQKELKDRKDALSDYNADYKLYVKATKKFIPTFIVIINNYENFVENFGGSYDDIVERLLREGEKYRIVFVFTLGTVSGLRYRTQQSFRQVIALQMNKDEDYMSIFSGLRNKRPSNFFGRGIVNPKDKEYYEYQTAKVCDGEKWYETITKTIEEQNSIQTVQAEEIKVIPDLVTINDLKPYLKDLSTFPIGISHKNITPCLINLKKNMLNFMFSNSLEEIKEFIENITAQIKLLHNINLQIVDAAGILHEESASKEKYIEFFSKLNNDSNLKDSVCIIIGLDKFIKELGQEDLFLASLDNAKQLKKCYYIIFESNTKMNNYKGSEWYAKYAPENTGVWLGNGAGNQYMLAPTSPSYKVINSCGQSYGYNFVKGVPSLIKLLGMIEKGDDNE